MYNASVLRHFVKVAERGSKDSCVGKLAEGQSWSRNPKAWGLSDINIQYINSDNNCQKDRGQPSKDLKLLFAFQMKLEKKRSASMDKILNKLRHAQLKAQDMRRATSDSQPRQSRRDSQRIIQYFKISSFSSCFVCHIPWYVYQRSEAKFKSL